MANRMNRFAALLVACSLLAPALVQCGIIKDVYQKITNTNNKTEDTVKQSAPICGSSLFSTPNENALSPEIIFITSQPSRTLSHGVGSGHYSNSNRERRGSNSQQVDEVAKEFRFHPENVSLSELELHGFNRDAPVTFLMHGFTSGYPLQAWISAMVEAYTIDRQTSTNWHDSSSSSGYQSYQHHGPYGSSHHNNHSSPPDRDYRRDRRDAESRRRKASSGSNDNSNDARRRDESTSSSHDNYGYQSGSSSSSSHHSSSSGPVNHNLFIINWNYAARGILYPRAVANIPIVASYVTRFINDKLIDEARVDPRRIQLVGHSLGAHLAGFIGKNTRSKVGRIYGLDPAGPCFGTLSGPLYPSSRRLAPSDAHEVITVQTNSVLLGNDRPLGRYSVYVEGGKDQPGCPPSGALKSLATLTWDGGDFDTVACSHSRAPNLLTYRLDQSAAEDNCQMVAYACKDWDSFTKGYCGVCENPDSATSFDGNSQGRNRRAASRGPLEPAECLRIGLDWQYNRGKSSGHHSSSHNSGFNQSGWSSSSSSNHDDHSSSSNPYGRTTTRPYYGSNYSNDSYSQTNSRPPNYNGGQSGSSYTSGRLRRAAASNGNTASHRNYSNSSSNSTPATGERRLFSLFSSDNEDNSNRDSVRPTEMFLRTGDTQPYCTFHYQVVLELNQPFEGKKPPMSIILQDSEPDMQSSQSNSLSNDAFGNKFDERTYTHLLTSNKKLSRIDHGTMIFREGLRDGHQSLKALHVNYMSHSDPAVRRRLSTRLCPVKTDTDRAALRGNGSNRFYFKPCGQTPSSSSSSSSYA